MAKKKLTLEEKMEEAVVTDVPYEVPENWVWTYMGNIGQYINGKAFKPTDWCKEGLPIIRIQNLTGTNKEYNYFDGEIEDKYKISNGELLMAWSATLDAFLWNNGNAVLNQHIFKVDSKINKKYHYYLLKNTIEEMYAKTHGTGMVHITKGKFEKIEISIPPLKEQQRIVDRIENLFEKLDMAKELIEEVRAGFEKRKSAILEKAFRGELTEKWRQKNTYIKGAISILLELHGELGREKCVGYDLDIPNEWIFTTLENVCLNIADVDHKMPKDFEGGIPYISPRDFEGDNQINFENCKRISPADFEKLSKKIKPEKGDIIFARYGTVGVTRFVNTDIDFLASYSCATIKTEKVLMEPKYVYYYTKSYICKDEVNKYINETTQKNVGLRSIKQFVIPVPPLEEQKEIVRILDKLLEDESKVEELTQLEEQIELIKKSILAKAFRGELGTNCEEEESALELLKEILSKSSN